MASQEVVFEEASPTDANELNRFLEEVTAETDLITKENPALTNQEMTVFLEQQAANPRNICLLAKLGETIIGTLNLVSFQDDENRWLGDIFLVIKKDYRGHGLGQILLEILLDWADEVAHLEALVLTVQARNQAAIHIYQKFGFKIDGIREKAVLSRENSYLDVYSMSRTIK